MLDNWFAQFSDWGLLILRLGLGLTFIPHGWMKLNPNGPMKGPAGFGAWLKQLRVPLPLFFGWLVTLLETGGAVLLIAGLVTRIVALGLAIDMLVAILLVRRGMAKAKFMDPQGGGWEFEFVLLTGALALAFTGAGAIALDRIIGL
jgi:putative oxidoreductase